MFPFLISGNFIYMKFYSFQRYVIHFITSAFVILYILMTDFQMGQALISSWVHLLNYLSKTRFSASFKFMTVFFYCFHSMLHVVFQSLLNFAITVSTYRTKQEHLCYYSFLQEKQPQSVFSTFVEIIQHKKNDLVFLKSLTAFGILKFTHSHFLKKI